MGWCLAVAGAAGLQGSSHCGPCGPHRTFQQQLPVFVLLELGEPLSSESEWVPALWGVGKLGLGFTTSVVLSCA